MKKIAFVMALAMLLLVPVFIAQAQDGDDVIADFWNVAYTGDYVMIDSVTGKTAIITGAVHLEDGVWIERGTTNLMPNPMMYDGDSSGRADSWTRNSSLTGVPTETVIRSPSVPGWIQRIRYTGVVSDAGAVFFYRYNTNAASFTAGESVAVSMYVYGAATQSLDMTAQAFDAALGFLANSPTTEITVTSTPIRYTAVFSSLPPGTDNIRFRFDAIDKCSDGDEYDVYFYGISIEKSDVPSSYLDGNMGHGYAWDGDEHNSMSTRITTTVDMSAFAGDMSANSDWSARIRWTPQYSSTESWPASQAFLFDTRGTSNNNRVSLTFEDDATYHVYINGADRFQSAVQTFPAGEEIDLWLALDFDNTARLIRNGGLLSEYNIDALSPPTGLLSFTLGSDVYGQNHINAIVHEFGLVDHDVNALEAATYTGAHLIDAPETTGVELLEGLVAYWPMNETSGVRYDIHGGYDLTDNNTVLYDTGVISNAAAFTAGNSEYLSHPYDPMLTAPSFTYAGWYSVTADNAYLFQFAEEFVISSEYIDAERYVMALGVDDVTENPFGLVALQPTTPMTWHHIVAWYDNERAEIGMMLDGVTHRAPLDLYRSSDQGPITLGRSVDLYTDGFMDEWGFWDRVLSDEERAALYNLSEYSTFTRHAVSTPTPTPTPVAEYVVHLPLVIYNSDLEPGLPRPDGGISVNPIDYDGDTTWWDWANIIAGWFAPIFKNIIEAQHALETLTEDTCSSTLDPFLSGDGYTSIETLTDLGDSPNVKTVAYTIGWALGAPVAWIRGILSFLGDMNLNYLIGLIYYMIAGAIWIGFVTVVAYGSRLVRAAIDTVIRLYELIPFKAT